MTKLEIQTRLDTTLKLIKKLEWSAIRSGPSTGMGLNNGPDVACCPVCRGIDPESPYTGCYVSSAIGHTSRCALNKAILAP